MSLSIRRVRSDDLDRVRELHEVALRDAGTDPDAPPGLADLDDPRGRYLPDGEFLVGEIDGDVVAMGGLERVDETTGELKRMRVDPEYQRRGYGRAILEALEDAACSRGVERLVVTTAARQDSAGFYRAQGYAETGREEWNGYELIHLEKPLDPTDGR